MRKTIIPEHVIPADDPWLDLEKLARVEITSEHPDHPIEHALIPGRGDGWRASKPGRQALRLVFEAPQSLTCIQLRFREEAVSRSQEFVLRLAENFDGPYIDLLRQGFHFSPPGTVEEFEQYRVQHQRVKVFDLIIVPDVSGTAAYASLASLRLA